MADTAIESKRDNTKLFRKIVREYNERTGFNFKLPKDTNYSSEYAHPVHEEGNMTISSQIDDSDGDPTSTRSLYALTCKVEKVSFRIPSETSYEDFKKIIDTDSFKYRIGILKQLYALYDEISDRIHLVSTSIIDDVVQDMEREENYDTILRAAKTLYKQHPLN